MKEIAFPIQDVLKWRRAMSLPTSPRCEIVDDARLALHNRLIMEELEELQSAMLTRDKVEVADAIGDMIYILVGLADECGIPLFFVMREIHESNMSKLGDDGKPVFREDGKLMKGPNFYRPDIKKILEAFCDSSTNRKADLDS